MHTNTYLGQRLAEILRESQLPGGRPMAAPTGAVEHCGAPRRGAHCVKRNIGNTRERTWVTVF